MEFSPVACDPKKEASPQGTTSGGSDNDLDVLSDEYETAGEAPPAKKEKRSRRIKASEETKRKKPQAKKPAMKHKAASAKNKNDKVKKTVKKIESKTIKRKSASDHPTTTPTPTREVVREDRSYRIKKELLEVILRN
jgi:hypothetical protein